MEVVYNLERKGLWSKMENSEVNESREKSSVESVSLVEMMLYGASKGRKVAQTSVVEDGNADGHAIFWTGSDASERRTRRMAIIWLIGFGVVGVVDLILWLGVEFASINDNWSSIFDSNWFWFAPVVLLVILGVVNTFLVGEMASKGMKVIKWLMWGFAGLGLLSLYDARTCTGYLCIIKGGLGTIASGIGFMICMFVANIMIVRIIKKR